MFEQRFDRPQSVEALRAMVVRKYGPPSEIDTSNVSNPYQMKYHVAFAVNHADLGICSRVGMSSLCPDAERDALFREAAMPDLVVSLTPTAIRANLRDEAMLSEGEAASKAAADAAREAKALANGKTTKLGL